MSDMMQARFRLIAAKANILAKTRLPWMQDVLAACSEIREEINQIEREAQQRLPGDR